MAADEPGRATQCGDGLLALAISAENRDVDPRRAQIGEHFDAGDGPEAKPRIIDLGADDVDHLLAEELAHLLRAPGHGRLRKSESQRVGQSVSEAHSSRLLTDLPSYRLRSRYLFAVEELHLIADLEIVEAVQAQAALVAGRNLADVIL